MKLAILAPFTPALLTEWIPELKNASVPRGVGHPAMFELVPALIDRGHNVHVITLQPGLAQPLSYTSEKAAVHVIPHRLRGSSRVLWNLERKMMVETLGRINPDVVHAHWAYEYGLAALDFDRSRTLVTAHDVPLDILKYGSVYYLPQFLASHLVYSRIRWLSGVAPVVTNYARRFARRNANVYVIPNIMPTSANVSPVQVNTPNPYVVTLGQWNARKNTTMALRAFQCLRKSHPHYYYALLGSGLETNGPAHAWAIKNGMAKNVHFLGPQPHIYTLSVLSGAALNLHPSRWEAHCMAIGEAMGLGIPVVAGEKSGGVPWELDYGQAGCLVDIESADAMAEGMRKVIDDAEYREQLVTRAKLKAESEYSTSSVIGAYESIYRAICGEHDHGAAKGVS